MSNVHPNFGDGPFHIQANLDTQGQAWGGWLGSETSFSRVDVSPAYANPEDVFKELMNSCLGGLEGWVFGVSAMSRDLVRWEVRRAARRTAPVDLPKCPRCRGKGQVELFTSIEKPCRDCGGTGVPG